MASYWLYPLSSISAFRFELDSGERTADTGPASLERLVHEDGREIANWRLTVNYHQVKRGDVVWVYYGVADGNRGIVAEARVEWVNPPSSTTSRVGSVGLRWRLKETARLSQRPFPATEVRKHVKWPAAAVVAVPPALRQAVLRHLGSKGVVSTKSPPSGRTPPVVERTISYTPPKRVTARLRHDAVIEPLRTRLEARGWARVDFDVRPKRVDLAMKKGRQVVLVEAKTLGARSSTTGEARAAFAQLADYSWRYWREHRNAVTARWALFERKPNDDDVEFLEHHGILVTWASTQRRVLIHGPRTKSHPIVVQLLGG
jgi:hypothetical protein